MPQPEPPSEPAPIGQDPAPDWPSWLRLAQEPGLGPASALTLLAAAGSPEALYRRSDAPLPATLPDALVCRLTAAAPATLAHDIERVQTWLAAAPDRYLLTLRDARYPPALLTLPDPPLLLYVRGQLSWLQRPALAVVGARHASDAGLEHAQAFAAQIARQGWCIVSGLARGIDAAAHRGALAAGPQCGTVAVLGTGIDRVYPAGHADLADRIAAQGALISEFGLGSLPLKHHFPRRNRLVAGLSHGVLVVEAARESGSLGTARLAADYGREVFALPGSIHSPLTRGCHALIREGAKLVETYADISDELGAPAAPRQFIRGLAARAAPIGTATAARATAVAAVVVVDAVDAVGGVGGVGSADAIHATETTGKPSPVRDDGPALLQALGFDPEHADTLARRSGLPAGRVQAGLLALELDGCILRLPDGRYRSNPRRRPAAPSGTANVAVTDARADRLSPRLP